MVYLKDHRLDAPAAPETRATKRKLHANEPPDAAEPNEEPAKNYDFYDAPVGLIFTIDKRLETGSYLDYGMFIQSVALAARGKGLHSCIQAAMSEYPDLVRRELGLSSDELVLCGMALGYADPKAIVNEYRPSRRPVEDFTSFIN